MKEEKQAVSVVDNKYYVGHELGKCDTFLILVLSDAVFSSCDCDVIVSHSHRGSFSVVKLGIHKESGRRVALKMIEKKTQLAARAANAADGTCQATSRRRELSYHDEVAVLQRIRHENVLILFLVLLSFYFFSFLSLLFSFVSVWFELIE
jgi:hypothetical protein